MTDVVPEVIVNFVLDESWSMGHRREQTIGAVNEYIGGIRADAEKGKSILFSLTLFNTETKIIHTAEKMQNIPDITEETYSPEGGTALLDAIGITVEMVSSKINKHKWRPAVLCVIMTDGEENSSTKFSNKDIKQLIATKEEEGNWTFIYLGADKEAWNKGASYGFSKGRSVGYDTSNMVGTMSALQCATSGYISDVDVDNEVYGSLNFFDGADDALIRGIDLEEDDEV